MSVEQYRRKLSVIIGSGPGGPGLEFSQFRVQFTIRRGDTQTPNSADVRIFNLKSTTANTIRSEFTQIAIQAGYDGNFGLIFLGSIKQYRIGRIDQKDGYVDVTAADGDQAYNFAPISASLEANAATSQGVASTLLNAMARFGDVSTTPGYEPNLLLNKPPRGRVFYGMARDEMRKFSQQQNCAWSIQDGKLMLIPLTSYVPGEIPLISPSTGLIGIPEQTQNGIEVRVLLNPFIKVGQAIRLDSTINQYRYGLDLQSVATNQLLSTSIKTNPDGLYYVMSVNHSGDTRGNAWYTDLTCLSIDATVPSVATANALTAAPSNSIPMYP